MAGIKRKPINSVPLGQMANLPPRIRVSGQAHMVIGAICVAQVNEGVVK
jgi:hypothetical protein